METQVNVIGIDPGQKGAIVLLRPDDLEVWDLKPCISETGTFQSLSPIMFNQLIETKKLLDDFTSVYCEESLLIAGNGIKTARPIYDSRGVMRTVFALLGHKVQFVAPQTWKRHFGLLKKDKAESVKTAIRLFPKHKHLFLKEWHGGTVLLDGRAEAALIALYGQFLLQKAPCRGGRLPSASIIRRSLAANFLK